MQYDKINLADRDGDIAECEIVPTHDGGAKQWICTNSGDVLGKFDEWIDKWGVYQIDLYHLDSSFSVKSVTCQMIDAAVGAKREISRELSL